MLFHSFLIRAPNTYKVATNVMVIYVGNGEVMMYKDPVFVNSHNYKSSPTLGKELLDTALDR